jgi:hypothetical protein
MVEESRVGVPDIPISQMTEDEQGLQVSDYAKALAKFIKRTDTPMTIGIQGDWGSGKTSLMNLIERELSGFLKVSVNTWKYSQVDPGQGLSVAVFLAVIRQLEGHGGKEGADTFKRIASRTFSLLGKATQASFGVDPTELLKKDSLDVLFEQYEALEKLRDELAKAVDVIVKKGTGKDRIVVFVDDLDRIDPVRCVEILEVLKNFLDIPNLVFVLACDYEVVMEGLRSRGGRGGEEVAGRSFFDKIIQVPFQMPVPRRDQLEQYIGSLLFRIGVSSIDEDALSGVITVLENTTGTNPRTLKRLANIVNLLLIILGDPDDADQKYTWDDHVQNKAAIVLSLVALQNAYPEAYAYLSRRMGDVLLPIPAEALEGEALLKRAMEKRPELSLDRLNGIIKVLGQLVGGDREMLARFIAVSEVTVVQSAAELSRGEFEPKRQVKSYIDGQPRGFPEILRTLLSYLPGDIDSHKQQDYIYFSSGNEDPRYVSLHVCGSPRRLGVVFEGPGYADALPELQRLGAPEASSGYDPWENPACVSCRLARGDKQPPDETLDQLAKLIAQFLSE